MCPVVGVGSVDLKIPVVGGVDRMVLVVGIGGVD